MISHFLNSTLWSLLLVNFIALIVFLFRQGGRGGGGQQPRLPRSPSPSRGRTKNYPKPRWTSLPITPGRLALHFRTRKPEKQQTPR